MVGFRLSFFVYNVRGGFSDPSQRLIFGNPDPPLGGGSISGDFASHNFPIFEGDVFVGVDL